MGCGQVVTGIASAAVAVARTAGCGQAVTGDRERGPWQGIASGGRDG